MTELPAHQLNPKITWVWRISDALTITLVFFLCAIPFFCVYAFEGEQWALLVSAVCVACYLLALIIFLAVVPPIRFRRWRYELTSDYLDIARGILWRKRFIIPFIRVQNTDTRQGPVLRAFNLASVTVSTAAGRHEIPGLDTAVAEQLRNRAAELARIAQEDV
ncbi:MAG: PH domain-containing protein [Coriobacteriales bacterium]|jgi:membrane protein YdbS with pleckstrin-like domain|nr:PH domain-containing protein [Coriobacteriales bacterium]